MQKPTIGRMLHYVMPNTAHRPAIVVETGPGDRVNLQVFLDGPNDSPALVAPGSIYRQSVAHSEPNPDGGCVPGTWHWPEREPEPAKLRSFEAEVPTAA